MGKKVKERPPQAGEFRVLNFDGVPCITGNVNTLLECRGIADEHLSTLCKYLNSVYATAWNRGRNYAIAKRKHANRKRLGVGK